MVIRRIREHVGTHNWFAVGIDLAIVVAGVFLGLQASNWNSARIERAEVRAYRAQIIQDLRSNERGVVARQRYFRQVRGHALAALGTLENNAGAPETFLINAYQATQNWPMRMERAAYDEMLVGGLAKSFGDPLTRQRLSSYYAMLPQFEAAATASTSYRERVRRAMTYAIQDRMRKRCNDVVQRFPDGFQLLTLPDRCLLELPAGQLDLAARRLKATGELEQDLTRHIGDLDHKLTLMERRAVLARELRLHLESIEGL